MPREAEIDGSASPDSLSRVLGLGGSSSLIMRSISAYAACFEPLAREWGAARQQLVQEHAQRVDVAARIDPESAHLRLLGAHVLRRADHRAELR